MTMKVALYCRVSTSTKDQTTGNKRLELESYCDRMNYEIVKIYEDDVSGAKTREKRPAYNELCQDAFLKKFDAVIGWDVSRFARSMKEFVSFLSDMDDKGIGVLEEWNREMLIERTNAGLARTVANGTKIGRKRITNDTMTAQIIELRNSKKTIRAITTVVGVSRGTVSNLLKVA